MNNKSKLPLRYISMLLALLLLIAAATVLLFINQTAAAVVLCASLLCATAQDTLTHRARKRRDPANAFIFCGRDRFAGHGSKRNKPHYLEQRRL